MPHSTYLPERMGSAILSPTDAVEAGSFQSFTLVYTAGYFGIDDTGSIKIVQRFAGDMGKPQWSDPTAVNYTTVEASNGAVLEVRYDPKMNIRPWDKTLFVRVIRGFLNEGDTITVRFGDRRKGSPGMRMQTFVEPTFEFRVLVDAFATYNYVELPIQPNFPIVSGRAVTWKALLPTLRRTGENFRLGFKGEDKWGNPSDQVEGTFSLCANLPVRGLPERFSMGRGEAAKSIDGLSIEQPGDLLIDVLDSAGRVLCRSNPLRIAADAPLRSYWCDLHGQSEETIGTNSARELIEFARDRAFLDGMSHQGNDFQITTPFWNELNRLTREYNEDGRFIIFPGYEWSGNTGLGGDRNVMFMHEGRQIHRSSHALVDDTSDLKSDSNSAEQLFQALKDEDCVVFAHIGGRYADIKMAHDARIERSVEVHSDWGTFEWLVQDALEQGYRIGILANSDGHKGRHGASHPGASLFGAYGGLSCLLATDLTRAGLFDALRRRHHYATTGCRMVLDVRAAFDSEAMLYADDPNLGAAQHTRGREAMMGDIVQSTDAAVEFIIEAQASAPIERLEIRNGLDVLETWRPYEATALGRRIRVIWEGSEYRGRGRQTIWDGGCTLEGNSFERFVPINMWNLDRKIEQTAPGALSWTALTTGGFGGFDAWLTDPRAGTLRIETPLVKCEISVADVGREDMVIDAGGIRRRIRIFRLPDENPHREVKLARRVALKPAGDNALYACLTQEDGHLIWSSPIYVFRGPSAT
ncbi:DUF3604 domain-containing protein [Reyranella aquatilis]|uniref:DUF3604 domain-containing protein n=1 Tax=Reyranella aquatilis TaxID=2035356 RepID=A0ABS8KS96_9HYPH|nr:DUF3604 domain-containing protein [Reyranella aquatilis]MCC8428962.1 DUF3604 domain-containing protein [Reyranella aquatilis]